MRLRAVGLVITFALGVVLAPLAADAQEARKAARIGYLLLSPLTGRPTAERDAFLQGLRELGYVENQNIAIEWRFAADRHERLPGLAAELVGLKVDVIVAVGSAAARAARDASRTIPIVMVGVNDPVGLGFVASLSRPGGNLTGLASSPPELSGKRVELLKQAVPRASRVSALWNPADPAAAFDWKETEAGARTLRLTLHSVEVKGSGGVALHNALSLVSQQRPNALIVLPDPLTSAVGDLIVRFATRTRLPTMYGLKEFVHAGGLMSYGVSVPDLYRRAATYVDKILKGAKPADLPVEQPTRFELVINLKTAKALGLTIPQSVLFRADELIR